MGSLTITIGPIVGTKNFNDVAGQNVVLYYLYSMHGIEFVDALSNQEKLNTFIDDFTQDAQRRATRWAIDQAVQTASSDAQNNAPDWGVP